MTIPDDLPPDAPALVSGTYELLNVLGSFTGTRVVRRHGERVPEAPIGWMWRYIGPPRCPLGIAPAGCDPGRGTSSPSTPGPSGFGAGGH